MTCINTLPSIPFPVKFLYPFKRLVTQLSYVLQFSIFTVTFLQDLCIFPIPMFFYPTFQRSPKDQLSPYKFWRIFNMRSNLMESFIWVYLLSNSHVFLVVRSSDHFCIFMCFTILCFFSIIPYKILYFSYSFVFSILRFKWTLRGILPRVLTLCFQFLWMSQYAPLNQNPREMKSSKISTIFLWIKRGPYLYFSPSSH